ncbi:MAG: hypothetical protein MIN69_02845 [Methylorubrum extorquens]|uniref:Uncharacterized protein n=1 Tax=Methylorubrum extorquens (strain DSM 6343 / CIP 106787 / DM4) TaxID=661410 RepID=C7CD25_METED|nr:hypothetical protein [Methylorubrum extorquens]CAX25755.1 conserved protein of unknown function [Methylorubrum extorquens DM4]
MKVWIDPTVSAAVLTAAKAPDASEDDIGRCDEHPSSRPRMPGAAADSLTPSQFGKRGKSEGPLGGGRSGAVAAQVTSSKIRPQRRRKSPKTNKQRKQLPLTSIWIG